MILELHRDEKQNYNDATNFKLAVQPLGRALSIKA
jgi:hypothetical protein